MKKTELLAPAGNMESLKAAAAGGCDAVYLGLQVFSARAQAGNFTHEEFIEAIRFCHIRNIRIYVTVNTMLYETEIENAIKEIDFLYKHDVDGVLIQDLGLFHYVRQCYPDLEVHCSTQMHIHNLAGVKMMMEEGASRIVLARETPIEIVREACKTGAEIEVFAYGAICISYSGQCLMSASIKNRSANRGLCAQCCRLRWSDSHGKKFKEGEYLLSPKDLNILDRLPELLDCGVASLKIEGRMKRPEYVYLVTKTFREAIDAYYAGKPYQVSEERMTQLKLMFNRGFSHGHLFHDDTAARMSQYRPNHFGMTAGTVLKYENGRVLVKLQMPLYQHDGLRIINEPYDTGLTAVRIYKNEKLVSSADPGDTVWLDCKAKPHPKKGQKLQKTSDTKLLSAIGEAIADGRAPLPVHIAYTAMQGQPLQITITDPDGFSASAESEFICQKAQKAPVNEETFERQLVRLNEPAYTAAGVQGNTDGVFLPLSVINETRRAAVEKLNDCRALRHIRREPLPYDFALKQPDTSGLKRIIIKNDTQEYAFADVIGRELFETEVVEENRTEVPLLHDAVLNQVADLNSAGDKCIGGMNLNIANSYAVAYLLSKGLCACIFSSEAQDLQISMTLEAFKKRYGFVPAVYKLVYGKRTLMYIKDGFLASEKPASIADYHENIYDLSYNNGKVEILESGAVHAENPYCFGSYLIMDGSAASNKEIGEEAYEELHQRI